MQNGNRGDVVGLEAGGVRWTFRYENPIGQELRSLAASQNWRCAYCGEVMLDVSGYRLSATRDHVVSRQRARTMPAGYPQLVYWENLVAACASCNEAKGGGGGFKFYRRKQRITTTEPTP